MSDSNNDLIYLIAIGLVIYYIYNKNSSKENFGPYNDNIIPPAKCYPDRKTNEDIVIHTPPTFNEYKTRNPVKYIPKDDGKSKIRDLDDGMVETVHAPISKIECSYFGEKDNYKDGFIKYNDTDNVDMINWYRNTNPQSFVGQKISDVYDVLNGNERKESVDLLAHEGTSFTPAYKNKKTFDVDRWHYDRENSNNGGMMYGFGGLKGYDTDGMTQPALTNN